MTRIPFVLLLAAAVAPWSSPAQERPAGPAGRLRIDVVAVDQQGQPVPDLRPAEFEVWISGYRVPIVDVFAVTPEAQTRSIVLILDNGAIGPNLAPRVREAARHVVNKMAPGDRLAIVPLHGGAMELTGDRSQLLRAIEAYYAQGVPFRPEDGGQHVLSTMALLARRLAEASDGRKTIVAIGAGWMFDTPLPPPGVRDLQTEWVDAMRAMAGTNTSLYVIDPAGLSMVQGAGRFGGASGFARETGGYAFLNTNDLAGAAARIWAEAGTYYILETANPPVQRTADLRELDVKVLRKRVTVRARRGIKGRP
ncbi:MAG: VWA domain-containing protein [Vicinamibacterales bacterium]